MRSKWPEGLMNLQLSDEEGQTLREMLHDYLPGLKFEVARTDRPEIRHELVKRRTLCERLVEQLSLERPRTGN
jgi:5S rRNA maturation endonuclease (ribonuclease M5)